MIFKYIQMFAIFLENTEDFNWLNVSLTFVIVFEKNWEECRNLRMGNLFRQQLVKGCQFSNEKAFLHVLIHLKKHFHC